MKIEHESVGKVKKSILDVIGKYLNLDEYRIFFFGSRVLGKNNERSDIDIGIEGKKKVPLEKLARIEEDIETLPILYKIDIVDFKNVSNDFYNVAKKKIEPINKS